ncbi:MAG: NAD(P)-dependent oxidoreductase [Gemmatimonadetes bacterium]|nr:NAD(P)-dependent oxidoreductase [Gemmatimonadota bacterium]
MRVLVAGGTGAIGAPLVQQLIERGHDVTATTRHPERADHLRRRGAAVVHMDGLDAASVGEAVARAEPDAIIHQMTSLSGTLDMRHFDRTFRTTNALRTTGTRHLLAAAQAMGVKRLVAQGYTGWPITRAGEGPSTESEPFDAHPAREQRETLAAIESLEQSVLGAPLAGIVLRYGSFYGAGVWDQLVETVRKRMLPVIGDGAGVWSWIHVDDAASATVAALERGEPGVYNVVDDEPVRAAEWIPGLAAFAGAKPPMHVPVWLGRLLAGDVAVRMMTAVRGASNEKAKWVLDWRPRWASWRDGFPHALAAAPSRQRATRSEAAA